MKLTKLPPICFPSTKSATYFPGKIVCVLKGDVLCFCIACHFKNHFAHQHAMGRLLQMICILLFKKHLHKRAQKHFRGSRYLLPFPHPHIRTLHNSMAIFHPAPYDCTWLLGGNSMQFNIVIQCQRALPPYMKKVIFKSCIVWREKHNSVLKAGEKWCK